MKEVRHGKHKHEDAVMKMGFDYFSEYYPQNVGN